MMSEKIKFLEQCLLNEKKINFKYNGKNNIDFNIIKIDYFTNRIKGCFNNAQEYNYKIDNMEDMYLSPDTYDMDLKLGFIDYYKKINAYFSEKEKLEKNKIGHNIIRGIINNINLNSVLDEILLNKKKLEFNKANPVAIVVQSNRTQKEAIQNSFNHKISVIQGPPGTGKTQTILNLIINGMLNNKKVLVVSKNNSAINNVYEKLQKFENIPTFYIRLGDKENYLKECLNTFCEPNYFNNLKSQYDKLFDKEKDFNINYESYYYETTEIEEKIDDLIIIKNKLTDLNQYIRHIEYKFKIYDFTYDDKIKFISFFSFKISLDDELKYLKNIMIKKENDGRNKLNLMEKIYLLFRKKELYKNNNEMLKLIWNLEYKYMINLRNEYEQILIKESIDNCKDKLKNKYEKYIETSFLNIQSYLHSFSKEKHFIESYNKLEKLFSCADKSTIKFSQIKKDILNLFPVVLNTIDAAIFNLSDIDIFDLVVVDEASQADIYSSLSILNKAKQIVIVGDFKQLSPITSDDVKKFDERYQIEINDNRCEWYLESNNSLLDFVLKMYNPKSQLLREHYRCDYNIINFCNKLFYDDELIIHSNNRNNNSLILTSLNNITKGTETFDKSYINRRESYEISNFINKKEDDIGVITPFKAQEKVLIQDIPKYANTIGTIHKFQGREHNIIYLSPVLSDEKNSIRHYKSKNNMFNKELINVAVSRAKNKLHVVSNEKIFETYDGPMNSLIKYIKIYGEDIKTTTFALFDGLYKDIRTYKLKSKDVTNIFEETLFEYLKRALDELDGFHCYGQFLVADIVGSNDYYDKYPEDKSYAINPNSKIDFVITDKFDTTILAIELDGENHKKEEQIKRDIKKDRILDYSDVLMWRIASKPNMDYQTFKDRLYKIISHPYDDKIKEILKNREWYY